MSPSSLSYWVLGAAWGVLVAWPVAHRARRVVPSLRAATLSVRVGATVARPTASARVGRICSSVLRAERTEMIGRVVRSLLGRTRRRATDVDLARELPVVLDLLGVAVGAGCTPYLAVGVAARWSPAAVAAPLAGVLRACALGVSLESALDDAARATPVLRPVADALLASNRLGAPVGPVLARLAEEERTALRRRAEAQARRIPIRLLFPLVFLVLPAFVLLTVVPGLAAGLGRL
jgi:hypothetical protein